MNKKITVVVGLVLAAGCSTNSYMGDVTDAPSMAPNRKVTEQDCSTPVANDGNLKCREVSEAEYRARLAEQERQAKARKEAEARAARERAERERLAREEAARKAREAEEERLAAERRRLEAEAARKAEEERLRREKAEAELLARQRAEQEAREAAERECRRREEEWLAGRALLENFATNYGKADEFKRVGGQISSFLSEPRKAKPCP